MMVGTEVPGLGTAFSSLAAFSEFWVRVTLPSATVPPFWVVALIAMLHPGSRALEARHAFASATTFSRNRSMPAWLTLSLRSDDEVWSFPLVTTTVVFPSTSRYLLAEATT